MLRASSCAVGSCAARLRCELSQPKRAGGTGTTGAGAFNAGAAFLRVVGFSVCRSLVGTPVDDLVVPGIGTLPNGRRKLGHLIGLSTKNFRQVVFAPMSSELEFL